MTEIKFTCSNKSCVSKKTLDFLKEVGDKIGIKALYITSTLRPPLAQATAMYENCVNKKFINYLAAGDAVQKRIIKGIDTGESKQDTLKVAVSMIEDFAQKGKRVSKHCVSEEIYRQCNIIDISYK